MVSLTWFAHYIATSPNQYHNPLSSPNPNQYPKQYPKHNTNQYPKIKFCRNIVRIPAHLLYKAVSLAPPTAPRNISLSCAVIAVKEFILILKVDELEIKHN